ncbi:uncharacterized protein RCO7_14115 [Rhynchosporium graminicola]|uniref:Uncharacterized protein n=1 Tax=Rhynchosporium graminicola TaxID=2792576 RepID=A0A1E1JRT6_9HELO|nr:uncharacterized protein RCO7_14115 [Rhynchosporium commune]
MSIRYPGVRFVEDSATSISGLTLLEMTESLEIIKLMKLLEEDALAGFVPRAHFENLAFGIAKLQNLAMMGTM